MGYSPKLLLGLVLQALILGAVLGLLYSAFRLLRLLFGKRTCSDVSRKLEEIEFPWLGKCLKSKNSEKHGRLLRSCFLFFGDVIFCVLAALALLLLAYVGNNGRIRWFMILGILCGFLTFEWTVGRILTYFSEFLVAFLRVICRYIVFVIVFPFRMVARAIVSGATAIGSRIRKRVRERRDATFHEEETKRLRVEISNGFSCIGDLGLAPPVQDGQENDSKNKTTDVKKVKRRCSHERDAKPTKPF